MATCQVGVPMRPAPGGPWTSSPEGVLLAGRHPRVEHPVWLCWEGLSGPPAWSPDLSPRATSLVQETSKPCVLQRPPQTWGGVLVPDPPAHQSDPVLCQLSPASTQRRPGHCLQESLPHGPGLTSCLFPCGCASPAAGTSLPGARPAAAPRGWTARTRAARGPARPRGLRPRSESLRAPGAPRWRLAGVACSGSSCLGPVYRALLLCDKRKECSFNFVILLNVPSCTLRVFWGGFYPRHRHVTGERGTQNPTGSRQ